MPPTQCCEGRCCRDGSAAGWAGPGALRAAVAAAGEEEKTGRGAVSEGKVGVAGLVGRPHESVRV